MRKKSDNGSRKNKADLEVPPITRAEMRRGVMGKYAREAGTANRFVELDQDVARGFRDGRAVNDTLRLVMKLREVAGAGRRKSA